MKRIALALSALVISSGGCTITSSNPTGVFTASWDLALDGSIYSNLTTGCTTEGAAYFTITATELGASVGDLYRYNCNAGIATTDPLPAGTYHITLAIEDSTKTVIMSDYLGLYDLFDGDNLGVGHDVFDFISAPATDGYIHATWSITNGGAPSTCAAVGGANFEMIVTPLGTSYNIPFYYNCADMAGTTDLLPAGSYHIVINLFDNHGHMLNNFTVSGTQVITAGATTDVGPFVFAF